MGSGSIPTFLFLALRAHFQLALTFRYQFRGPLGKAGMCWEFPEFQELPPPDWGPWEIPFGFSGESWRTRTGFWWGEDPRIPPESRFLELLDVIFQLRRRQEAAPGDVFWESHQEPPWKEKIPLGMSPPDPPLGIPQIPQDAPSEFPSEILWDSLNPLGSPPNPSGSPPKSFRIHFKNPLGSPHSTNPPFPKSQGIPHPQESQRTSHPPIPQDPPRSQGIPHSLNFTGSPKPHRIPYFHIPEDLPIPNPTGSTHSQDSPIPQIPLDPQIPRDPPFPKSH